LLLYSSYLPLGVPNWPVIYFIIPVASLSQQLYPFFRLDALLEDCRHTALVQFTVDDGVRQRTTLELPSFCFVLRQVPSDEVVGEWLCPGWYLPYMEDTGDQGINSPRVRRCAGFIWLAGCRTGLETAAPEAFVEPTALGWPAVSFSPEAATPESGGGA
jgi:hypothetical protein